MNMYKMFARNTFRLCINVNRFINRQQSSSASAATTRLTTAPAHYCLNTVRQYDYENFICTLLLHGKSRECAFAVRAFNVEVSRIQDQVTDSRIGLMRLKFWEETLDQIYSAKSIDKVPAHPVAVELFKAVKQHSLTKRYFQRLFTSRAKRLQTTSYLTLDDIMKYAEDSVSCVYFLLLESHGIRNVHADHAASHLGKAQGITNLLRSLSASFKDRVVYLPQDILMKHGVSQETILRKINNKAVADVIFEVASAANQHLTKARELKARVPSKARQVLLPAAAVENYLEKLRKSDFQIFNEHLLARNNMLPIKIYYNKIFRSY